MCSDMLLIEVSFELLRLPRWLSGRKYDCRIRGLGFDSQVSQSIVVLTRNLELYSVYYGNRLTKLHGTYNKNDEKGVHGIAALHAVMCTSAIPLRIKGVTTTFKLKGI
ncbi:hypothetical protein SFRURICE_002359 [Spodoptera frugiperda]|nr:hypothetical protein SFRURICE_002359 [Spodoptera frugiperda]